MSVAARFMLDTNICIYALNQRPVHVLQRIVDAGEGAVCISSITAAELAFGAVKSTRAGTRGHLEAFLRTLPEVPWGGQCRVALRRGPAGAGAIRSAHWRARLAD